MSTTQIKKKNKNSRRIYYEKPYLNSESECAFNGPVFVRGTSGIASNLPDSMAQRDPRCLTWQYLSQLQPDRSISQQSLP